jgi:hypothetical protein
MLGPARSFLRLSVPHKRIHLHALLLLAASRVAVKLRPVACVRAAARIPVAHVSSTSAREARAICSTVERMSRYVPSATCLPRALVANRLLRVRGFPSTVRIGVRRDENGLFAAHAWLELRGEVVMGGDVEGYASLPPIESVRR